jgi:Domain of unknown function (DUF4170)
VVAPLWPRIGKKQIGAVQALRRQCVDHHTGIAIVNTNIAQLARFNERQGLPNPLRKVSQPIKPVSGCARASAARSSPPPKPISSQSAEGLAGNRQAVHGDQEPPGSPDGKVMTTKGKQLLHFVFGSKTIQMARTLPRAHKSVGELTDLSGTVRDLSKIDIVGIYPDYASALQLGRPRRRPVATSKAANSVEVPLRL